MFFESTARVVTKGEKVIISFSNVTCSSEIESIVSSLKTWQVTSIDKCPADNSYVIQTQLSSEEGIKNYIADLKKKYPAIESAYREMAHVDSNVWGALPSDTHDDFFDGRTIIRDPEGETLMIKIPTVDDEKSLIDQISSEPSVLKICNASLEGWYSMCVALTCKIEIDSFAARLKDKYVLEWAYHSPTYKAKTFVDKTLELSMKNTNHAHQTSGDLSQLGLFSHSTDELPVKSKVRMQMK